MSGLELDGVSLASELFGYPGLRPEQRSAIQSFMEGSDVVIALSLVVESRSTMPFCHVHLTLFTNAKAVLFSSYHVAGNPVTMLLLYVYQALVRIATITINMTTYAVRNIYKKRQTWKTKV